MNERYEDRCKAVDFDSIQAYLGGGMDMNRANETRDMTKRLEALSEKYQCAIVLVGHMNKAAEKADKCLKRTFEMSR